MANLKSENVKTTNRTRSEARLQVIIELLEHARALAADEDEHKMAGHIDKAIKACCQEHVTRNRANLSEAISKSKPN